jgi:NTE family protein
MLIRDFQSGTRKGTYWGIASQIKDYDLEKHGLRPIAADSKVTAELSGIRTRLNAFSEEEQGRLINWGYAMADTAIRRHVEAKPMGKLPIPKYPL